MDFLAGSRPAIRVYPASTRSRDRARQNPWRSPHRARRLANSAGWRREMVCRPRPATTPQTLQPIIIIKLPMPDTNTEQQSPSAFAPTGERSLAIRQAAQIVTGDRGLKLTNYEEMYRFAKAVALSKFNPYPNDWTDVDCFICLQKGAEVGMSPMQSLESIYVVNNRATIFGDAPKGLVEASGLMIDYDQYEEGKPFEDDYKWIVSSHRRGRSKPLITTYSVADAKTAGLWDK